jgi:drug/metabolite transporter (DMT)-like permease
VAALLLGLWAHILGQGLDGGQFRIVFLAGMIGFGGGGWCMFQAFPRIGSTLSLLIVECAAAILTTIAAMRVFGAAISLEQGIFVLMIIVGVSIALLPSKLPDVSRRTLLTGAAFAATAAVGQSLSWILTKSAFTHAQETGFILNPMTAAYQRLLGGAVLAVMVFSIHRLLKRSDKSEELTKRMPEALSKVPSWIWVVANAMAGPVLGVSCMLWAIREVQNPGLVQAVVATATLLTVPLAREMENRVFETHYYIGAVVAILGVGGLVVGV